jgi:translation initiation factor 1A
MYSRYIFLSSLCACYIGEYYKIGKRKVLTESYLKELILPQQGELLGRVIKLVGGDNIIVKCTDGKVRTCRIRGKIKRRMWIRDNDLVLVSPWDFQSDRADIIWRYIAAHADKLEQDGYLADLRQLNNNVVISS